MDRSSIDKKILGLFYWNALYIEEKKDNGLNICNSHSLPPSPSLLLGGAVAQS